MNALIPAIIALVTVFSMSPANAESAPKAADVAVTAAADTTAAVEATADAATATETAAPENYTLEDGTAVIVEGGKVFTVDAKGVRTPAPDGDHATKEGKTLKVLAGALVPEAAVATEASAEVKTEAATDAAPATTSAE